MSNNLPDRSQNAESVAKITSGVGTAIAAIFFPPAALAQPFIDRLIERWVRNPEKILIETVRSNGITEITLDQVEAFVPMAYKFFKAAKEGEYQNNLRILGKFISSELKEEKPDPARLKRASRCIEGISETTLKVFSYAHRYIEKPDNSLFDEIDDGYSERQIPIPGIVEATPSCKMICRDFLITLDEVNIELAELATRNLLYGYPALDMNRSDFYYYAVTQQGIELINKAVNV